MARARKSHETNEEETKPTDKLKPAYSGNASKDRYVIYASYPKYPPYTRNLVLKFNEYYAARFFVMSIIGNDTYEWCEAHNGQDLALVTQTGIYISTFGDLLSTLIDYVPTPVEAEWKDPQVYTAAMQLKYSKGWEASDGVPGFGKGENDNEDEREDNGEVDGRNPTPAAASPKPKREPKPERAARPDTAGHISANDIAKKLGVEGREVRGVLRALKLNKPAHGNWSWPPKEAEGIEAQIVKGLKEAKKGKKR